MSGEGLFLDIIPLVNLKGAEAASVKLKALWERTGADVERTLGAQAQAAIAKMSSSATQMARTAAASAQKVAVETQASFEKLAASAVQAENAYVAALDRARAAEMAATREMERQYAVSKEYYRIKGQNVVATTELTAAEDRLTAAMARGKAAMAASVKANEELAAVNKQVALSDKVMKDSAAEAAAANRAAEAAAAKRAAAEEKVASRQAAAATAIRGATMVSAGYVVAVGLAAKSAADFQSSQMRLVASAGESASNLKMVSDGILKMAGDVGYSAQELSKGMYTVESAGYRAASGGLDVLKAAAQGAKTENASLESVTNGLTTSLHDFNIPANKANEVMSKMVVAVGHSKVNFQSFAGALHSVEPAAAGVGMKLEDVYATLAMMTQSGSSAEQATENMRNAINSLQAPTQQMREEMAQFGLDADEVKQHLGSKGLTGTMQEVANAIYQHLNPAQQLVIKTMYQSKQAGADMDKMYAQMTPAVKHLADGVKDGSLTYKDYRHELWGLSVDEKNLALQWMASRQKFTGYNQILKNGQGTVQLYGEALKRATGTVAGQTVALQVTGKNAKETNDLLAQLNKTTADGNGDVKGFHEVMGTLNGQLDRSKAAFKSVGIEIGTVVLPVFTKLASGVAAVFGGMSKHAGTLKLVTAVLGGMAAAMIALKVATLAQAAATGILNAVMAANPITLIVIAIAGLIGALVYAYNKFTWFHNAVQAVWDVLKKVGEFIKNVFVAAWRKVSEVLAPVVGFINKFRDVILVALGPIGMLIATIDQIVKHWNVVGPIFKKVGSIIADVFKVMFTIVKYTVAIIATIIGVTLVLAFKLCAAIIKWWWNDVLKPVFDLVGKIFQWIWTDIMHPIINLAIDAFKGWAAIVQWFWDNVIHPIFNLIGDLWKWIWNDIIKPIVDLIKEAIQGWGLVFQALYDHTIKPVADLIGTVMQGIKNVFKDCVDWVETQWNRIKHIVAVPAKFVIENVYNDAIVPVWDGIAGVFGLPKINKVSSQTLDQFAGGGIAGFAGGGYHSGAGILPGYAPGRDTIPAVLSPGESVLTPEATRMLGPKFIFGINAMSGRKSANADAHKYLSGGGILHADGGFFGGVKNIFGDVVDGVKDMAKFTAELATDPVGAVKHAFSAAEQKLKLTPDGGGKDPLWRKAMIDVPEKVITGAIDKAKEFVKSLMSGGGGSAAAPAQVKAWIAAALQACGLPVTPGWINGMSTLIMRESGGNPQAVNLTDSNAAAGHPSRGLTQTIPGTFSANHQPGTSDNITDPVANIAASINYVRRSYGVSDDGHDLAGKVQQANSSMPAKGYAGGGIVGFDGGGITDDSLTAGSGSDTTTTTTAGATPAVPAGYQPSQKELQQLGGAPVATSMWKTIKQQFPNAVLNSAKTDHGADRGYHPEGKAIDIGGPLGQIDDWIFKNMAAQTAQLIFNGPPSELIYNVHEQGHGGVATITDQAQLHNQVYAGDLPGHSDHVHWAAENVVASPGADAGAVPSATIGGTTIDAATQKKIDALKAKAKLALDDQKKHLAAADDAAAKAKTAKTPTQKAKYLADVQKYKDLAASDGTKAQNYLDQAKQLATGTTSSTKGDSSTTSSTPDTSSSTSDTSSSDSGHLLTTEEFGSRLGGIAADGVMETFGLTQFSDPNSFPLIKIPYTIGDSIARGQSGQAKPLQVKPGTIGSPLWWQKDSGDGSKSSTKSSDSPDAKSKKSLSGNPKDKKKKTLYDDGGWLEPGLTLVDNQSRRPEPVLNFDDKRKLDGVMGDGVSSPKATVLIENMHNHGADGKQVARDIYREMAGHSSRGPR